LNGSNDNTGVIRNVGGANIEFFVKVENLNFSGKLFIKGLAVWVAGIFQGFGGLSAYGVGRDKPEYQGAVCFAPYLACHSD
jgi:hypothetical protein